MRAKNSIHEEKRWIIVRRVAESGDVKVVTLKPGKVFASQEAADKGMAKMRDYWEFACSRGIYIRSLKGQFDQHNWLVEVAPGQTNQEAVNAIPGFLYRPGRGG